MAKSRRSTNQESSHPSTSTGNNHPSTSTGKNHHQHKRGAGIPTPLLFCHPLPRPSTPPPQQPPTSAAVVMMVEMLFRPLPIPPPSAAPLPLSSTPPSLPHAQKAHPDSRVRHSSYSKLSWLAAALSIQMLPSEACSPLWA